MTSSQTSTITAKIEGLAPRGQAYLTHNDRKYYFDHLLPGDEIEIEFDADGQILTVDMIKPSSTRIKSDCHFYGPCGGCDLLELPEKIRKSEKQNMIKRCVNSLPDTKGTKIHKFAGSQEITGFMPRVRLHQGRDRENRSAGYLLSDAFKKEIKGGIVPVKNCPILMKPLNKRLVAARKILSQIPICLDSLVLMCSSSARADRVTGHATLQQGKSHRAYFDEMQKIFRAVQLKGLSVSDYDGKIKEVIGSVTVTGLIAPETFGGPFVSEPSFFVQGNIYQNKVLVDTVVKFCNPKNGMKIVEGFAGAANFSIPLAVAGASVKAYESHPGAVRSANKNIAKLDDEFDIEFFLGDAIKDLKNTEPNADVLLLDPPRSGTPGIGKLVKSLSPKQIVYIFCDLISMEKDSKQIIANGYTLKEVKGIDMYPRTHHIETVCRFVKN